MKRGNKTVLAGRDRKIQFMIAGAPKAATTSMFRYLAQHPTLWTHAQREMTFFSRDAQYDRGFDKAFQKYYGATAGKRERRVLAAKDVMAMYWPPAIERMYAHNPNMRLAVFLRRPVERAYSAYWYARRQGWERASSFEEALELEESRLKGGWLNWQHCSYLYNGVYYPHVERLFTCFGPENVSVYLTDDVKERPLEICRELFGCLGVDDSFHPEISFLNTSARARSEFMARTTAKVLSSENPFKRYVRRLIPYPLAWRLRYMMLNMMQYLNETSFKPPSMEPATRARLLAYYRPRNEKLAGLIGRDLEHWSEDVQQAAEARHRPESDKSKEAH